jgi:hypothetical protein
MHKYENNELPLCLKDVFNYNRDIHSYNTRNQNKFRQPSIKTKTAELFITNMGPKIWNDLEGRIDKNTSLAIFKTNLIGLILGKYG